MWLINSSIGRKVVMSVTGVALILFLTFHGCMNMVALFSEEGYNMICEFLGANWYAVVATLGLAALAVIHIILIGMLIHLWNFWYNMMFAELVGAMPAIDPTDGFGWIKVTFSNPVFVVIYIIWLAAIWFHLTHGFWSAMQTLGVSGKIWLKRWQCIGMIYVTVLMLMFLVVVLAFAFGCAPSLSC